MTTTDISPVMAAPGRVGQGTAVEQSRAIAEVHAAIVVAQQVPRNIRRAERDMERACARRELAGKAFFRFRRGGETVTGPSIHLARELARCWGNIQYGLTEMRRDDDYGQSEMQAWAWDVETNARASTTFIVPHRRDRSQEKGGPVTLTDMRDIYENNANNGARRLREMIFAVLPVWYIAAAVEACYATLSQGEDGQPLSTDRAVAQFAKIGVKAERLEQKLGGPRSTWTARDLAELRVIYDSISRGEARQEDEFPGAAERVTAAEVNGNGAGDGKNGNGNGNGGNGKPAAPQARPPADPTASRAGRRVTAGQVTIIEGHAKRLGFEPHEQEEFTAYIAKLARVDDLSAIADLTQEQAQWVQGHLKDCADRPALVALAAGEAASSGQAELQ